MGKVLNYSQLLAKQASLTFKIKTLKLEIAELDRLFECTTMEFIENLLLSQSVIRHGALRMNEHRLEEALLELKSIEKSTEI